MEMRMESGSVETVVQGHERYACRVYFHAVGMGIVYHDSTELVDRSLDLEIDWRPGVLGISEAVFVAAEDSAFEAATI